MTPSHLWPELKPWFKQLERNRARLEAWIESAEGIVSFELQARRSAVEPGGDELLAAIIAEPDEACHRLVYADWLITQGHVQGELIQLCEQRRVLGPDPLLDARIESLTRDFGEQIAGEVAQLASDWGISRGFVARMQMPAATFAKHGERLLARAPIDTLVLKPVDDKALARLAKAPALQQLRGLQIGQIIGRERPMSFDALCASPHLTALRRLRVSTWTSSGRPEAAFAGLAAEKLESLSLYEVDAAPAILAGLAQNPVVRLRGLDISLRTPEQWRRGALASPAFARTSSLELDTRGPSVGHLFEGAELPALLDLQLGDDVTLDALNIPSLRRLRLGGGRGLTPDTLTRLFAALPKLELLQIWRIDAKLIDAVYELCLALPESSPLVGLSLPHSPGLFERAKARFPHDVYDFDVHARTRSR